MIEIKRETPYTNAEKIRNMSDEDLNTFLFAFKVGSIARFVQFGGQGILDAEEQAKLLSGTEKPVGEFNTDWIKDPDNALKVVKERMV